MTWAAEWKVAGVEEILKCKETNLSSCSGVMRVWTGINKVGWREVRLASRDIF